MKKLTKPQQKINARFENGEKISRIGNPENYVYKFSDGSNCHYRVFWNLMQSLYGMQLQNFKREKYFAN